MSQDPAVYPEPHIFRPERFLESEKGANVQRDPARISFGFGRRWISYYSFSFAPDPAFVDIDSVLVAILRKIQYASKLDSLDDVIDRSFFQMFITVATVLAVFEISKAKDLNGDDVEPEVEYCSNILR